MVVQSIRILLEKISKKLEGLLEEETNPLLSVKIYTAKKPEQDLERESKHYRCQDKK